MSKYFFISLAFLFLLSCNNNSSGEKKEVQQATEQKTDDKNNKEEKTIVAPVVNENPELLGRFFFNAIAGDDYDGFFKYVITKENAQEFVNRSSDANKPAGQEMMNSYDEQINDVKEGFHEMHNRFDADFWKNAGYKKTEYSTRMESGNEIGDMTIVFTSADGEEHRIRIARNVVLNKQWHIIGDISFDGENYGGH